MPPAIITIITSKFMAFACVSVQTHFFPYLKMTECNDTFSSMLAFSAHSAGCFALLPLNVYALKASLLRDRREAEETLDSKQRKS